MSNQENRLAMLPITVLAQYVKDLSFENPNAPQSLVAGQPAPQVGMGVDVQARQAGEDIFEVELKIRAEAKAGDAMVFLVDLVYAGLFSLPGLPPEHHRPVLLIEGPRLLFPFARSIVATITSEGGYPPLLLNPIDFAELYRRQNIPETEGNA
ncbi:Protein-export protein SecB [Azospirillaceae bacterium]